MQDSVTIARPYAKAAFDYALSHQVFQEWSQSLAILGQIVMDKSAANFIQNPETGVEQQVALLINVLRLAHPQNVQIMLPFVTLLAKNQRLMILPDICLLFEALRLAYEKKMVVEVKTFYPLSSEQEKALQNALSRRFDAQVTLVITIDKSLLGGAVIKAGDWVMDGSIKNKLNRLGMALECL